MDGDVRGPFWSDERGFVPREPHGLALALTLLSTFVLAPWELLILTRAALHASFERPLRGLALVGRTARGIHSTLWIFVLVLIAILPIALVVVGLLRALGDDALPVVVWIPLLLFILVLPRLATLIPVFVGEDSRGSRAIGVAWRLSRGAWAASLGVLVLVSLIGFGIGLIPGAVAAAAFPDPSVDDAVARSILGSLATAVISPIGVAISVALYLELSGRKGLADQASLRARLARFDGA